MKIRSSTDEISILLAEKGGKFCAKLFYNLQVEAQEVKYSRAVWNKLIVPKHIFIFWQACNVQLLTRDHLSKFLSLPSTLCPLRLEAGLGVVDWPKDVEHIQHCCTRVGGPLISRTE
ncbi:hypothetical protein G4B88_009198 [Cannabis sativa]|uniref:Reverse transcriptase zinc-binding domain-containing protein n=1 Tax=Cannabis sativa TaxID=3483 RepID=A0A7J6G2J2_CANSA|nr:hypothetical protein G4B88_009198 [Cannabis sativa]